jgi:hypothetical protein
VDEPRTIASGPCQNRHSLVQVPQNSWHCLVWDSPNLGGLVPVFISLRNGVAQLYHRSMGSLFIATYDSQGYSEGVLTRLHTDSWRSVSQYVLVLSKLWTYDQIFPVWKLLCCLCGVPSLTRGRVCLLSVSQQYLVHCQNFTLFIFYKSHFIYILVYTHTHTHTHTQYIQGFCLPRHSTADHAPSFCSLRYNSSRYLNSHTLDCRQVWTSCIFCVGLCLIL